MINLPTTFLVRDDLSMIRPIYMRRMAISHMWLGGCPNPSKMEQCWECTFLGCAAILAAAQPLKIVFVVVVVVLSFCCVVVVLLCCVVLLQPNQLLHKVF